MKANKNTLYVVAIINLLLPQIIHSTSIKIGTDAHNLSFPTSPIRNISFIKQGIEFVYLEPGTFTFNGSDKSIRKPYWLSKYEINQKQWNLFHEPTLTIPFSSSSKRFPDIIAISNEFPIYNISIKQTLDYCDTLTKYAIANGLIPKYHIITLPTQNQWLYACIGRKRDMEVNQIEISYSTVNVVDGANRTNKNPIYYPSVVEIGSFPSNKYGFHDMYGNVWEFCVDNYMSKPTSFYIQGGGWTSELSEINNRGRLAEPTYWSKVITPAGLRPCITKDPSKYNEIINQLRKNTDPINTEQLGPQRKFNTKPSLPDPQPFILGNTKILMQPITNTKPTDTNKNSTAPTSINSIFWLSSSEISQQQWKLIMGSSVQDQLSKPNNYHRYTTDNYSCISNDHPIYYVSWEEAMMFCSRVNRIESENNRLPNHYIYTLPLFEQWKRAALESPSEDYANMLQHLSVRNSNIKIQSNNTSHTQVFHPLNTTSPVKSYPPNNHGLHDMFGNVSEWCLRANSYNDDVNYKPFIGGNFLSTTQLGFNKPLFHHKSVRKTNLGFRLCLTRTQETP